MDNEDRNLMFTKIYAGDKMKLFGWSYPVVIDLKGLVLPTGKCPLIAEFQDYEGGNASLKRIGENDVITINDSLYMNIKSNNALNEKGYCIEADVVKAEFVDVGSKQINGKTFTAPFYYVEKSELRGVREVKDKNLEYLNIFDKKNEYVNSTMCMSLDEAIDHYHEKTRSTENFSAIEHNTQLYVWLKELKNWREKKNTDVFSMKKYIEERKNAPKPEIPRFEKMYVAVDIGDQHVLDNEIFSSFESAKILKEEYLKELPSLNRNEFRVLEVSSKQLKYGDFPFEKQMYFCA